MVELGKDTGPTVWVRFKICEKGSTDWAPIIIGARALDCPERGGMGFLPMNHAHSFSGLGILMERYEDECLPIRDEIYAIRCSAVDSEDEAEAQGPTQGGGCDREGAAWRAEGRTGPSRERDRESSVDLRRRANGVGSR